MKCLGPVAEWRVGPGSLRSRIRNLTELTLAEVNAPGGVAHEVEQQGVHSWAAKVHETRKCKRRTGAHLC